MSPLRDFVDRHELAATFERLSAYADLLVQLGKGANLVGAKDRDTILDELVLDSLLPAVVEPPAGRLIDLGSGAGIPAIPLTIAFGDRGLTEVHLVEPRERRATFLAVAARRLGLDLQIHRCRLEDLPREMLGSFDLVSAKAFRPPLEWLGAGRELLVEGGRALVYASDGTWTEEVAAGALAMGYGVVGSQPHPTHCGHVGLVLRRVHRPDPAR